MNKSNIIGLKDKSWKDCPETDIRVESPVTEDTEWSRGATRSELVRIKAHYEELISKARQEEREKCIKLQKHCDNFFEEYIDPYVKKAVIAEREKILKLVEVINVDGGGSGRRVKEQLLSAIKEITN